MPNFEDKGRPNPAMAQVIFIMFGLFYDYFIDLVGQNEVEKLTEGNTVYIIKGFSRLDIKNVPKMVEDGLCVLNKIKEKQWLERIGNSFENEN